MTGAVCPACGVAVVPGYVKCPRCHRPLPYGTGRRGGITIDPGGTTLRSAGRFPLGAILIAVVVGGGIIAYFSLRSGKRTDAPATLPALPNRDVGTAAAAPVRPTPVAPVALANGSAKGPTADSLAADLDRTLKRRRLWSTVSVVGDHVDVRSSSCSDPAIRPLLDAAMPGFKAAGLTRLRCLEQSGVVISARDL